MRKEAYTASSDIQPVVGIAIFIVNIESIVTIFAKVGRWIVEITEAFTVSEFSMQNVQVGWVGEGRLQDSKGINFTVELFIGKETGILSLSVEDGDGIICE